MLVRPNGEYLKHGFNRFVHEGINDISNVKAGFYTKLNIWGSLGLNFDYEGGPIIENGGPICLYMNFP